MERACRATSELVRSVGPGLLEIVALARILSLVVAPSVPARIGCHSVVEPSIDLIFPLAEGPLSDFKAKATERGKRMRERFEVVELGSSWRELEAPDGTRVRVRVPLVAWRGTGERAVEPSRRRPRQRR